MAWTSATPPRPGARAGLRSSRRSGQLDPGRTRGRNDPDAGRADHPPGAAPTSSGAGIAAASNRPTGRSPSPPGSIPASRPPSRSPMRSSTRAGDRTLWFRRFRGPARRRWLPGMPVGAVLETRDATGVTRRFLRAAGGVQKIAASSPICCEPPTQGSLCPELISARQAGERPHGAQTVGFYLTSKLDFVDNTDANPVTCVAWGETRQRPAGRDHGAQRARTADIAGDGPIWSNWFATTGDPSSVEADQALVLPGAANLGRHDQRVATANPRRACTGPSPRGVRFGIEWDQPTLAALAIDPNRAVQAPWPIRPCRRPGDQSTGRARRARHHHHRRCGWRVTTGGWDRCPKGFVRGPRKAAPAVPTGPGDRQPALALPEREPRNIVMMIAIPALLVGIIGMLVVMHTSGPVRCSRASSPHRADRLRRHDVQRPVRQVAPDGWGEQEKERRVYLRQLDEDRDEVQRAARTSGAPVVRARRSAAPRHRHRRPADVGTPPADPAVWTRRPARHRHQQTSDSAVSLQWPEVPIGEELEPVTGGALRDPSWSRARSAESGRC